MEPAPRFLPANATDGFHTLYILVSLEVWPIVSGCYSRIAEGLLLLQMSKLIMSHMSKEPFGLDLWPTVLLSSTLLNSWIHLVPAFPLACIVNVLMLAGYIHYVTSTVLEICAYLKISCFSIPLVSLE